MKKKMDMCALHAGQMALLVIDMQNGFVEPDSPLCVAMARFTIPALQRTIDQTRKLKIPICWIGRCHGADGSDMESFRKKRLEQEKRLDLFAPEGKGIQMAQGLELQAEDWMVWKTRFSAFFKTDLDQRLREAGIKTLLVAGTQTPNCVRHTAMDALQLDYEVFVLADCTSSQTEAIQQANLCDLQMAGIGIIENSQEFLSELDQNV